MEFVNTSGLFVSLPAPVSRKTLLKNLQLLASVYRLREVVIETAGREEADSQNAGALSRAVKDMVVVVVGREGDILSRYKNGGRL